MNNVKYLLHFRRYSNGAVYKGQGRIDGKVVIVTGANTGIGKETAMELVKRGQYLPQYTEVSILYHCLFFLCVFVSFFSVIISKRKLKFLTVYRFRIAFGALTLLVGRQEEHLAMCYHGELTFMWKYTLGKVSQYKIGKQSEV